MLVLYIFINIYNTILYSPQIQKTVICHNCHLSLSRQKAYTVNCEVKNLAVWKKMITFARR